VRNTPDDKRVLALLKRFLVLAQGGDDRSVEMTFLFAGNAVIPLGLAENQLRRDFNFRGIVEPVIIGLCIAGFNFRDVRSGAVIPHVKPRRPADGQMRFVMPGRRVKSGQHCAQNNDES